MLEDRYTEIERENRILLEKMTSIMQHNNRATMYSANAALQTIPNQVSVNMQPASVILQKKSLNKDSRKRELLKITMEN